MACTYLATVTPLVADYPEERHLNAAGLAVLEREAQAGTALSRDHVRQRGGALEPGDLEELVRHLARHDTIRAADFEIPGTWVPDREEER